MADNPIKVKAYGKILSFPAGTAPEAIESALAEHEHVLNPDYKAPQPEALDYAKGFASGANKLGAGVGFLMEAAGAKESGRATREFFNRGAKYWNDKMSKGGKLASQSQVFVDDDSEDSITGIKLSDDWGKALLMGASESLPSMFAAAIPGVAITKGIQALAKLGLAGGAGATIPLLAGTAAPVGVTSNIIARVPSAVGFGAAEGVTAGAMNAADFKTSIEGMTDEELNKSPVYRALKEEHDPTTARSLLAEQASIDLFGKTAVSTGTIGALTGGGALSQAYQKVTTGAQSGILGTMLKGAGTEALQETPQSGGEKFIENLTTQKFLDPNQSTTEGVLAAAASGGAIGAFTGGVVGAGGAINITPDRRSQLLDEKRKVAEMKADAINTRTMEESAADIGAAQDIDQALAAATRATTKPVVSANEVLRSEDPTLADIEKLTGLKPTEAIDTAIDEIENPIINQPQETENVSNQETQQAPTTEAAVLKNDEPPKTTNDSRGATTKVERVAGRSRTQADIKAAVKTAEDTSAKVQPLGEASPVLNAETFKASGDKRTYDRYLKDHPNRKQAAAIDSKIVEDNLIRGLQKTGKFTATDSKTYAKPFSEFYRINAERQGILPSELYERMPLNFKGKGKPVVLGQEAKQTPADRNKVNFEQKDATPEDFTQENVGSLLNRKNWAILTAANPEGKARGDAENLKANEALQKELADRGLAFEEVQGRYPGDKKEMPSYLVYGIDQKAANELGNKYGQDSVLTREGLVHQNGKVTPVKSMGKGAPDGYTRVPRTGARFAFDLDWGREASVGEGALSVVGRHYSKEPRKALEGSRFGTGYPGKERDRINESDDPRLKSRVDFYVDTGEGVTPESGLGPHVHETLLHNIYDGSTNPRNFKYPSDWLGGNVFEKQVLDAGYDGYYTKQGKQGRVVVLGDAAKSIPIEENNEQGRESELLAQSPGEDTGARESDGSLKGLPRQVGQFKAASFRKAQEVAKKYMKAAGLEYNPPTEYVKVNEARAKRIAQAFDEMKHEPQNPEVKAAYDALVKETTAQYKAVVDSGLKVEFIDFDKTGDPYEGSPRAMTEDVRSNNHMWVFSTRDGFGSSDFDPADNPLLAETEFEISGQKALVNDLFRVVHDYFGHVKEGVGFRAAGEENAWMAHMAMFSPLAGRALTTETRGQNSWVNYGPFAEHNKTASGADTKYADQKIGLLPEWASTEGRVERPTVNSEGKPIPNPEKFYEWFGDSKVVDKEGRPLTVYHGTAADIEAFRIPRTKRGNAYDRDSGAGVFFTNSADQANYFAFTKGMEKAKASTAPEGSNVVPAYLSMKNPLIKDYGDSPTFKSPDEVIALKKQAESAGNDGIILRNVHDAPTGKPADVYIVFGPTQIKSATGNSGEFNPNDPNILKQRDRAGFNPRTFTISLMDGSDLSSVIHEGGHFYLEALADMASRPDAPEQIVKDFDTTLRWFGVEKDVWGSMPFEQKRPYHEQWAQSFERYALEGKAPSKEMQSVFDRFQEWMLDVYKSLKEFLKQNPLAGKLNDEVRSVFDRLLATEQDIAKSREAPTKERSLKNGERAKQLERKLREQGYDFTITAKDVRDFAAGDRGKEIEANTAEKIAGIFGRKIVWIDAQGDYDINGVVVPSIKDTIFIDVNTDKAAHAVMGHELSHHLEHDNPDVYDDLLDSLSTVIKDHQGYAKKYGIEGVRKDDITKEIVGDIMGDNFTRPEFWNRVAEANPSTFKSIADSIIKWLKNLILKAKSRGLGSDQWVTDSQKAQDILAKAIAKYEGLNDSVAEDGAKFHKVWHGSPHDHSKFDSAKIGTGEGAQAYGYGHYFTDTKEVAEYYKEQLSDNTNGPPERFFRGVRLTPGTPEYHAATLLSRNNIGTLKQVRNEVANWIAEDAGDPRMSDVVEGWRATLDFLNKANSKKDFTEKPYRGKLYEVELAPEQEDYLLWDKPLSEQSEKVKEALKDFAEDTSAVDPDGLDMGGGVIRDNRKGQAKPGSVAPWVLVAGDSKFDLTQKDVDRMLKSNGTGESIYSRLAARRGSQKAASEYLHSLGIRGIKYLDGTSRSKGEGAYNYVVFDDKDIEITAKFSRKAVELKDKQYLEVVESGDLESAQKMVDTAAREKGYMSGADYRMMHQAPNREDYNLATIKESGIVPEDYWTHPHYYQSDPTERSSFRLVNEAIDRQERTGRKVGLLVYRSVPKNVKDADIRNGDWVTPSREYARLEGESIPGGYRIISAAPNIDNLWWDANSINELGYDDGKEYAYKNTKNNRKLIDPVTYDDEGNVIPLSKRFNSRNDDIRFSKAAPKTININGVERPTTNSEGNPIPNPEKFYAWFKDSKVVDDQGRPLVVYHGTDKEFYAFDHTKMKSRSTTRISHERNVNSAYAFAQTRRVAEFFANKARTPLGVLYPGSRVLESYLSLQNPLIVDVNNIPRHLVFEEIEAFDTGRKMSDIALIKEDSLKLARKNGNDGVIFKNGYDFRPYEGLIVFAFNPSTIKSATENTGEFSLENNDIRFSKKPEPFDPNTDIPETLPRKAQRLTQDAFNRFTVIKDWLKKKGVTLSEKADVYQAEERYHSLVANQLEDFREQKRNPLIEKIAKAGFTMADVSDFLEAQHAAEANAAIQKISNNDTDTAYGITDKEAADYLAEADPKLATLANELRNITEESKQMRLKAGLLSQEEVDAWESTYQHYIPVKGDSDAKGGTGKGLKVNFKTKRRLGHGRRDEAVIENIFLDHERAIMQVEKNRVAKHLVMMAAEMQMPEIMTVGQPVKRKTLRNTTAYEVKVSGVTRSAFNNKQAADMFKQLLPDLDKGVSPNDVTVEQTKDQRIVAMASPMLAENEINAYIDGHAIRVQLNDDLLARAYSKLGVTGFSALVSAGRAFNGYLSKVYTGYNPEFIITNMIRDFTSGLINLTGEEGIKMAAKTSGNYVKSFSSLMRYAVSNGKKGDKWIDMYRANGGNTGAAYLSDLERLGDEVKTEYAAYQGVMANLKSGSFANAARAAGRKVFNLTLKWIYNLNQAGENAMRLAAFRAMIESGKTPAQAAKAAKNITVNFNRKGELGAEANAAYLFFNASVQGVAALAHAHFKGEHKYQAWGLSSMVGVLGYMAAAALLGGDDDEYDKLNDYTKSRNLLIKAGEGYAQIPIPYGYGFFWNMGRSIAEAQHKGELGNLPWHIAASAIEELTPFSDTVVGTQDGFHFDQVMLGLLPTVIKIPAQPAFNKQLFSGSELMPDSAFQQFQPDREKLWRATQGTMYDRMSGWLDEAIGADVSPETLKHYTRTFTGGAGAMVDATVSAAMLKKEGAELEPSEIPFVRKAYSKLTIREHRAAYYKAREEAKKTAEEFTRAKARNDVTTINKLVKDEAEMIGLDAYANKLSKAISAMRDMQDAIRLDDNLNAAEKRTKIKELELTEQKFYDQYLDVFKIEKLKMKERQKD